jgi:hypothetical protein
LLFHWLIGVNWWLDCILAGIVAANVRIGAEHYVVLSEHDHALIQLQNQMSEMAKIAKTL